MNFPKKGIYFLFNPLNWESGVWEKNLKKIVPLLSAIQLRAPDLTDREFYRISLKLKEILKNSGTPFIVNNRVDLAIAVKADGIHLGEKDLPLNPARRIFEGIIGSSRHTSRGAKQAEKDGADYIGCGPVFKTETKKLDRKVLAPEGYKKVKNSVNIPVIPVGGIKPENIKYIKGYSSIFALSSAINCSLYPLRTCRKIKKTISLV